MESSTLQISQAVKDIKEDLTTLENLQSIISLLESRFKSFRFHTLKDIPHPQELLNNMEASLLVVQSIFLHEKVIVVGDYDADGVCATCIILDFFESLGYSNISYSIPNRFKHGYGFSRVLLQDILQEHPDVKLIITVDNGVSSFEAGEICKQMGIKFIITDHHTLEIDSKNKLKIPPCDFLINPQQKECGFPYKDICGSLVAWYFCCGIKINIQKVYQNPSMLFHNDIQNNLESIKMNNTYWDKDSKAPSAMQNVKTTTNISYKKIKKKANLYVSNLADTRMEEFLLLVGIAIISDVMPLNALNHTICRYALKNFTKSKKSAIQILIEFLNCKIDSQALGFKLIPLLNAAGRIDDGKIALDFLRSKSILEAKQYFKKLKALNMKRKQLQDEVTHEAFEAIGRFKQNSHIICAVGDDWHEGVLGIVAGKMTNDFKKPCFALTNINGVCKGSGRSYGNIDLISSMQSLGHLTNRHGGHIGAVGLEIPYDNIQEFINSFRPVTRNLEKPQNILGILPPNLVTHELLHCIELFEPYGNGNPTPKFFLELKIIDYRRTAQGFLEFKLDCGQDSLGNTQIIKGMFFNSQYATYPFRCGNILHFCAMVAPDMQISHQQQYRAMTNRDNIMLIIEGIYGI